MIYSSHISWSSPTTPTPLELYPALAFDRLFKDEVQHGDEACWTRCWTTPKDLRQPISRPTAASWTNTCDSVREVEQRIDRVRQGRASFKGWRPTLDKPNITRPADGVPQDIAEHMRLMCDILVLGLPDRHHADLHAQVEQRSLVVAVPQPGRRLHDPSSAVAHRRRPTGSR